MDDYQLTTHICRTQQEMEATDQGYWVILDGLGRNILAKLGNVELGISIRIFLRTKEDKVVGGVVADVFGQGAHIALLWVDEPLRNKGYGSELVNLAEQEARKLGCTLVHTDTYGFEAMSLYKKLGYEVFGALEDYTAGYGKYFLKKSLTE